MGARSGRARTPRRRRSVRAERRCRPRRRARLRSRPPAGRWRCSARRARASRSRSRTFAPRPSRATARRTRASRAPFGGMQVIVVGDFAQLAPVEGDFAFTAKCWDALFGATTVVLTEVFRQRDAEFVAALHALRTNTLAPAQFALLAACDKPVDGAVRLFAVN